MHFMLYGEAVFILQKGLVPGTSLVSKLPNIQNISKLKFGFLFSLSHNHQHKFLECITLLEINPNYYTFSI